MIPVHEFYLTDDLGNRYLESGKFELRVGTSSDRFISTFRCISVLPEREDRRCPELSFKSRTDGKVIQAKGTVRDIQATRLPE